MVVRDLDRRHLGEGLQRREADRVLFVLYRPTGDD
jgi:hypothetical protein